jgi:hypothetical protein
MNYVIDQKISRLNGIGFDSRVKSKGRFNRSDIQADYIENLYSDSVTTISHVPTPSKKKKKNKKNKQKTGENRMKYIPVEGDPEYPEYVAAENRLLSRASEAIKNIVIQASLHAEVLEPLWASSLRPTSLGE